MTTLSPFLRDQCRVGLFKAHNGIVQICPTPQQLFATLDDLAAADPETLLRKVKSALASEEFRVHAATRLTSRGFAAGLLR